MSIILPCYSSRKKTSGKIMVSKIIENSPKLQSIIDVLGYICYVHYLKSDCGFTFSVLHNTNALFLA